MDTVKQLKYTWSINNYMNKCRWSSPLTTGCVPDVANTIHCEPFGEITLKMRLRPMQYYVWYDDQSNGIFGDLTVGINPSYENIVITNCQIGLLAANGYEVFQRCLGEHRYVEKSTVATIHFKKWLEPLKLLWQKDDYIVDGALNIVIACSFQTMDRKGIEGKVQKNLNQNKGPGALGPRMAILET